MKFTKMSLVAALLVGSSAFAIDNVKVSGDAKLYYGTDDSGTSSLLNKNSSYGQAAASLSLTADLTEGVSAGSKVTALTTLGLQGQLVNAVWEAPNGLADTYIVNDLWLATTVANTTAKIGRMALDTPLVFTEKWSIVENTFESAVLINTDVPDTTIVAAYVGGSNSQFNTGAGFNNVIDTEVNNSTFSQFFNGAYAVGAINNSWAPLTAQAWYYAATSVTTAYWLQADLAMEGFLVGAQYTGISHGDAAAGDAFAVMAGYEMKDTFTAKIAYSQTGKDASAGFNLAGSGQSKLYTEAWWNYGMITQADTSAINLTVEAPIADVVDLGAYITYSDANSDAANDLTEVTLTASKSFGPLDTSLVYIYADINDNLNTTPTNDATNTVQAYLTYNF